MTVPKPTYTDLPDDDPKVVAARADEAWVEQWKALRAPFPASAIGKKPQPYRRDAEKGNCDECGKYHGLPALHLDFLPHAFVTDRLLDHDPAYSLEPSARDAHGQPLFVVKPDGELTVWAKLTVFGVTHEEVGYGGDEKAAWSDVLKRCAMRHGIGLDIWKKEVAAIEEGGAAVAVPPEENLGLCPDCKSGRLLLRKKKNGDEFVVCSAKKREDPLTCQFIDWDPNVEWYKKRGAPEKIEVPPQTSARPLAEANLFPPDGTVEAVPEPKSTPVQAPVSPPKAKSKIKKLTIPGRACPDCGDGLEMVYKADTNTSWVGHATWSPGMEQCKYRFDKATQDKYEREATGTPAAPEKAKDNNPHWKDTVALLRDMDDEDQDEIFTAFGITRGVPASYYRDMDEGQGVALLGAVRNTLQEKIAKEPATSIPFN